MSPLNKIIFYPVLRINCLEHNIFGFDLSGPQTGTGTNCKMHLVLD